MKSSVAGFAVRVGGFALACALAACSSAAPDSSSSDDQPTTSNDAKSSTKQLQIAKLPDGSTQTVKDNDDGTVTVTTTSASGQTTTQTMPASEAPSTAMSAQRAVATKLGAPDHFLVGLGNDGNGSGAVHRSGYELGTNIDIHYMYLSGLSWTTWNSPVGAYVGLEAAAAKAHGAIPMFTLYQAAEHGDGNLAPFATDDYMTKYWANVRILFAQLDAFGDASILHVEPDFWGYAQKQSKNNDPSTVPVKVNNLVPECKDLPNDVSGFGKCMIRLARQLSPSTVVGLSASAWGSTSSGISQPDAIATFMKAVGADKADLLVLETLDRDAGCFEAATDANCKRSGSFYWTQQDFTDHLTWAKSMHDKLGLPLLWWQMPLGVPASSAGSSLHYRDNRVQYFFAHPDQFAAAGGIGAVFGTGAANQTTVESDGGQFKKALAGYAKSPVSLQ